MGASTLTCKAEDSAALLNICMENSVPYRKLSFFGDTVKLEMSRRAAKRLSGLLEKKEIEHGIKSRGIPVFLEKYKKRYGLAAGAAMIFALIFLSTRYVWDIRVDGNSSLTDADVKNELAAEGFHIGSRIGERDVDEISNAVLLKSEKIAWLSINFRGNVAEVQIREKDFRQNSDSNFSCANIVASCDGVIDRVEILRGTAMVKEGDGVRKGELLISGLSENKSGAYRTEKAMGAVYAITSHHFSVEIPLVYEKTVTSEPVCTEKSVIFFSKKLNIYRNSGKTDMFCVKIEKEKCFSVFGLPPLPISIGYVFVAEEKAEKATRSEKEASELAFFEMERLLAAELKDADLLKKTVSTEITSEAVIISCDVICSENIAVSVPFGEDTSP